MKACTMFLKRGGGEFEVKQTSQEYRLPEGGGGLCGGAGRAGGATGRGGGGLLGSKVWGESFWAAG